MEGVDLLSVHLMIGLLTSYTLGDDGCPPEMWRCGDACIKLLISSMTWTKSLFLAIQSTRIPGSNWLWEWEWQCSNTRWGGEEYVTAEKEAENNTKVQVVPEGDPAEYRTLIDAGAGATQEEEEDYLFQ